MVVPESTTTRDAVAIKTVMAVIKAVVAIKTVTAVAIKTVMAVAIKTVVAIKIVMVAATKTVVAIRTAMEGVEVRTTEAVIAVALDQTTEVACNPMASRTPTQA